MQVSQQQGCVNVITTNEHLILMI